MFMDKRLKHGLHCCLFFVFSTSLLYVHTVVLGLLDYPLEDKTNFFDSGSYFLSHIFLVLRILAAWGTSIYPILSVIGLLFYNCFEDEVPLKQPLVPIPFICFRTVTRGNFPDLVRRNVEWNKNLCLRTGLENFVIQVVTDKDIDIPESKYTTQIVVPSSYVAKSGVLFKGRALQYAIEDHVNTLNDEDWIVHLDEETLLTSRSICGIINFAKENKYPLGQGLIIYSSENIINWKTTLLDFWRVADDMGRNRVQLQLFHKLLTDWKGSYLVCKAGVERDVTFDHGIPGSVAEDTCFGLMAASKGYKFNFIEGEMWEKSPFTIKDQLLQRKRWYHGGYLITFNPMVPFRSKCLLAINIYSLLLNIMTLSIFWTRAHFPWYLNYLHEVPFAVSGIFYLYFNVFGILKSYSLYKGHGFTWMLLCLLLSIPASFINAVLMLLSQVLAFFSRKLQFHIVQKEYKDK